MFTGLYRLYRWPVAAVLVVFAVSLLLGGVLPTEAKIIIFQAVGEKFADIILRSGSDLGLTWNIFLNNLVVAGLLFGLGFTIGLALLIIVGNGMIMGLFVSLLYRSETLAPGTFTSSMIALIPHGIFELTAVFLAGVLSAMVTLKIFFHKYIEPNKTRRRFALEAVGRLVCIVVPLLLIASWAEVYISNQLSAAVQRWWFSPKTNTELSFTLQPDYILQQNCAPVGQPPDDHLTFDANALGEFASVLYDDGIYQQLRYRQDVSSTWQQFISCNDDITLSIQTWESAHWSGAEAEALTTAMLQAMNTDFAQKTETTGGITYNQLITKEAGRPKAVIWIFEYGPMTVNITTSDPAVDITDLVPSYTTAAIQPN